MQIEVVEFYFKKNWIENMFINKVGKEIDSFVNRNYIERLFFFNKVVKIHYFLVKGSENHFYCPIKILY